MHVLKYAVLIFFLFALTIVPASAASEALPLAVSSTANMPLEKTGAGTYRKYGFRIYIATLWAPDGDWRGDRPYALSITYARSLSKDTVLGGVMDGLQDQDTADDATLAIWRQKLSAVLLEVKEGDVLVGLSVPGQKARLFYNGEQIAAIDDPALSKAFFDIWLGDKADEDLRSQLLGKSD